MTRMISDKCFECGCAINSDNSYSCNQCSEDVCITWHYSNQVGSFGRSYCFIDHNEHHKTEQAVIEDKS